MLPPLAPFADREIEALFCCSALGGLVLGKRKGLHRGPPPVCAAQKPDWPHFCAGAAMRPSCLIYSHCTLCARAKAVCSPLSSPHSSRDFGAPLNVGLARLGRHLGSLCCFASQKVEYMLAFVRSPTRRTVRRTVQRRRNACALYCELSCRNKELLLC